MSKRSAQVIRSQFQDGNFSLTLSHVSLLDEMWYSCYYRGQQLCRHCLRVGDRFSDPVLLGPTSPVLKGTEVNFTCKSDEGFPVPWVQWFVNKKPFQDKSRIKNKLKRGRNLKYNLTSILTLTMTENVSVSCMIDNRKMEEKKTSPEKESDCSFIAIIGETVQIPCSLNTEESLKTEDISVEWKTSEGLIVHSFVKGQDYWANQAPQFKGRTQLFKSELPLGNLSLRLSSVSVTDEGVYACNYHRAGESISKQLSQECLQIAGRYSVPVVQGPASPVFKDSEVSFTCKSTGGFPEPKVQWSVNKELLQNSGQVSTTLSKDSRGLYNVTSVLTVNVTGDVSVTCTVENDRLREKRTSAEIQSCTLYTSSSQNVTVLTIQPSEHIFMNFLSLTKTRNLKLHCSKHQKRTTLKLSSSENVKEGNFKYQPPIY
ncbi:CD276 protein, partial [Polypterus senegalus]